VLERTAVVAPLGDRWADKQVVLLADLQWTRRRSPGGRSRSRRASVGGATRPSAPSPACGQRPPGAGRSGACSCVGASHPSCGDIATCRSATAAGRRHEGHAASRRSGEPRAVTASAITEAPQPEASKVQQPALTAELRRAQQRIAELEAELERHRAVALHVVRRVEVVVGRRAA